MFKATNVLAIAMAALVMFSAPQATAQRDMTMEKYGEVYQQYTGRKPGGAGSFGVDDASDVPMLDVDSYYDSQYDPPPVVSPPSSSGYMPGCPDGSTPILGFCGDDIPGGYNPYE